MLFQVLWIISYLKVEASLRTGEDVHVSCDCMEKNILAIRLWYIGNDEVVSYQHCFTSNELKDVNVSDVKLVDWVIDGLVKWRKDGNND